MLCSSSQVINNSNEKLKWMVWKFCISTEGISGEAPGSCLPLHLAYHLTILKSSTSHVLHMAGHSCFTGFCHSLPILTQWYSSDLIAQAKVWLLNSYHLILRTNIRHSQLFWPIQSISIFWGSTSDTEPKFVLSYHSATLGGGGREASPSYFQWSSSSCNFKYTIPVLFTLYLAKQI